MSYSRNTIWVSQFGAVGDGVADDTASITRALAAARPGSTVMFDAGATYKTTSQITVPKNGITLMGYGAVITSAADTQYRKFLFSSRTRGAVIGLRFECLYTSATTGLGNGVIEINASTDITVRDCEFNEVAQQGIYILGASTRCNIESNRFYKNFCAIFSDDDGSSQPTMIRIAGNEVRTGIGGTGTAFSGGIKMSGTGALSASARHVIEGNILDTVGQMGVELQTAVNDCSVTGNTIKGTGYGVSISGCWRTAISANSISSVTSYGVEVASGSLETTVAGNSIYCASGAYGVIIVSSSKRTSIFGNSIVDGQYAVYIDSSDVTVTANSFYRQAGNAVNLHNATNVIINDNTMAADATMFGFIALDGTDAGVQGVTIDANRFTTTGAQINCCIHLYSPNAKLLSDIYVTNNTTNWCSFAATSFNNSATSGHLSIRRLRCYGNACSGAPDDYTSLSVPVFNNSTTRSFASFNYGYYFYDGAVINNDASAGIIGFGLPATTGLGGYTMTHVKSDSSSNPVLISGYAGATIQGLTSVALTSQYTRMTFVCDGASSWVITQSGKA